VVTDVVSEVKNNKGSRDHLLRNRTQSQALVGLPGKGVTGTSNMGVVRVI